MNVSPRTAEGRAVLILAFLVLATSLPFVNRAYFVDDFYFVTMAKGILQHPLRPYDFVSDDAGRANIAWERGQRPRMVNPPVFHYFLAAVIRVWGDAVWKLRTASLIFPLISVVGIYFLGKRFVRDPLAAASLVAITPVFWLTSYSLLIDGALLAFLVVSLWSFIEGQERQSLPLMSLCGILMGLTVLVKYTGVIVIPLVLFWHFLYPQTCSKLRTGIALAIFAVLFLLWGVWNIATYGQMHFLATLPRGLHSASPVGLLVFLFVGIGIALRRVKGWPWICWGAAAVLIVSGFKADSSMQSWLTIFYLDKILSVASFLGGGTIFLVLAMGFLFHRSKALGAMNLLLSVLLFICFRSRFGLFTIGPSAMLALFIGSSIAFLLLAGEDVRFPDARNRSFVQVWLGLALLELIFVMPWTAGRYFLVVLPAVVWIFRGLVEEFGWTRSWRVAWAATLIMGAGLAYVDYSQANVIRQMAELLVAKQSELQSISPRPPHAWFYLGDTFSGYPFYLEPLGWKSAFPDERFQKGDLILRARYRSSTWWTLPDQLHLTYVGAQDFKCAMPLRVMDVPDSAGFYASVWGSLPFVFTPHPLERMELYRVAE